MSDEEPEIPVDPSDPEEPVQPPGTIRYRRNRWTGVVGNSLRFTGASLVNGKYELGTIGQRDFELGLEIQMITAELRITPIAVTVEGGE
jgi:hypothetical protein